tara:strand:- start:73 stop:264 length:192 start_codon:yes stop_codon:yes gene_type:complete
VSSSTTHKPETKLNYDTIIDISERGTQHKKNIIAAALTALFSAMENANSSLADRIKNPGSQRL